MNLFDEFRSFCLLVPSPLSKIYFMDEKFQFDGYIKELRKISHPSYSYWFDKLKAKKYPRKRKIFNFFFREYFNQSLFSLKAENNNLSIFINSTTNIEKLDKVLKFYLMSYNYETQDIVGHPSKFGISKEKCYYMFGWGSFVNHNCGSIIGWSKIVEELEDENELQKMSEFYGNKSKFRIVGMVSELEECTINPGEFTLNYGSIWFKCNCSQCQKKKK